MDQGRVEQYDHIQGPADAPVTLIEYVDFQCPFCARAHGALRQLRERLGDQLRLVVRHLPRPDHHPFAELAAEASEAAAAQGKFWEMHDALFAHQERINPATLPELAQGLGLDVARFRDELQGATYRAKVQAEARRAQDAKASSTPAIFINGERYHGDSDPAALGAAIEAALRGQEGSRPRVP
jgi:protein-disulfide isomerase